MMSRRRTAHDIAAELDSVLTIAATHRARMTEALDHLRPSLPIDATALAAWPYEVVASVELLLSRFGKLQDVLGAKVFPLLAELGAEPLPVNATFLDVLHRLEKTGAVPSAEGWRRLREVRNAVAHDSPDDPEIAAASLAEVFVAVPELLAFDDAARAHFRRLRVRQ